MKERGAQVPDTGLATPGTALATMVGGVRGRVIPHKVYIDIMGGGPGVRMGWNAPPTQWSPKTKRWQRRWGDRTSCPTMFFAPPDDVRKKLSKLGFAKSAPCHVGSVSCWIRVTPKRRNETNPTAHGKRPPGLVSIVFGFGGDAQSNPLYWVVR